MYREEFPVIDSGVTKVLLCAGASHALFHKVDSIISVL